MKLWLDDIRPCPDGYLHARSVNEAIKLLEQHGCTYASLDHDLGDYAEDGGDGVKLVLWMAERDRWPSDGKLLRSRPEERPLVYSCFHRRMRSPPSRPPTARNDHHRASGKDHETDYQEGDRPEQARPNR